MKLRNKKTGEIVEPFGITCLNGRTFVQFDDGKGTFKFEAHSLAELNKEWEDYEEPEIIWYINSSGITCCAAKENYWGDSKEIGNWFETKEEAEKAVEKLKALKRLKDKGFKFKDWRTADLGADKYYFIITAESDGAGKGDLDLLFGGEE